MQVETTFLIEVINLLSMLQFPRCRLPQCLQNSVYMFYWYYVHSFMRLNLILIVFSTRQLISKGATTGVGKRKRQLNFFINFKLTREKIESHHSTRSEHRATTPRQPVYLLVGWPNRLFSHNRNTMAQNKEIFTYV